jgi:hypothetical protein
MMPNSAGVEKFFAQGVRCGARPGHQGHGRRDIPDEEITRQETVPGPERCPYSGGPLDPRGSKARTIIEVDPVRKEVIGYELEQRDSTRCQHTFTARPAGVFAKGLFGVLIWKSGDRPLGS